MMHGPNVINVANPIEDKRKSVKKASIKRKNVIN